MHILTKAFGLLALGGCLLGCDSKGSACPGTAGFYCIVGGCSHDLVTDPICSDGTFACPSGSVDRRTCGNCVGLVPSNCTCSDAGGLICTDASAGQ